MLCQPFTTWVGTSTFVEPGLVLAVALALWNLVHFARTGWTPALVLTGVFAGAAAGMKYQGVAAALLIACALVLVRDRLTVRRFALAALPALAVALPWYVKNAILTGNPVYPLFFGGANDEADRLARASFEEYGHGTSLLDLVLLPFRLLGDAEAFDRGEFASPLPLLFAPLALLAPRGRRIAAVALALCVGVRARLVRRLAARAVPAAGAPAARGARRDRDGRARACRAARQARDDRGHDAARSPPASGSRSRTRASSSRS